MDFQIEVALIGAFQMIVVAIIGWLSARDSRKRKKALEKAEARAVLRAEESLMAIGLMSASVNLGIATATAIKDGKVNGIMQKALDDAERAGASYQDFLKSIAAKEIAGR